MESAWILLMLVGAVTGKSKRLITPLSYEQALASAVKNFNKHENYEFAFRLLEAEPKPDWKDSSETTQRFKFFLEETVCCASETPGARQCNRTEFGDKVKLKRQSPPSEVSQELFSAEPSQASKSSLTGTTCCAPKIQDPNQCNSKANGANKECFGSYRFQNEPLMHEVSFGCLDVATKV